MHGIASPTRLSQYKKLLSLLDQGLLGAKNRGQPVYTAGQKTCGVGALFNAAQLQDIRVRHLNTTQIGIVAQHIGTKNLEAVTGFTIQELQKLQDAHDAWISSGPRVWKWAFRDWLERRIQEESQK